MREAAQGELRKHQVFHQPFEVHPVYEDWETPSNYREYPGDEKLPATVKVWRTGADRNREHPYGTVTHHWGYEDSPDAEILTAGYNDGKENGAVGVGRHGNFLQWGFGAPPSKMTEAGAAFFLNCIVYISQFDGKAPLIHTESGSRFDSVRLAMLAGRIRDKDFVTSTFPSDIYEKYGKDPKSLMKFYQDNYEYIYRDGQYRIDEELKTLGIASNRTTETLERLISLLGDKEKSGNAAHLLKRYTTESFRSPAEWRDWLAKSRNRIYFSDVGGYKFRVIPPGYLEQTKRTR